MLIQYNRPSLLARYGIAKLLAIFALVITYYLHQKLASALFSIPVLAVVISAGVGGIGPGLFASGFYLLGYGILYGIDQFTAILFLSDFCVTALFVGLLATAFRKKVEQFEESRARFVELAEMLDQIVAWEMCLDSGKFNALNPAACRLLGYRYQQCVEEKNFWFNHIYPEDKDLVSDHVKQVQQTKKAVLFDHRYINESGSVLWFQTSMTVKKKHNEKGLWLSGLSVDITHFKENEETQRLFAELSILLSSSLDYKTVLEKISRIFLPRLADWCVVDLYDEETKTIQRVSVAHYDPKKAAIARELQLLPLLDLKEALAGPKYVVQSREPEFLHDITPSLFERTACDPKQRQLMEQLGICSYMCVPMIARDRSLGALSFIVGDSGRHYSAEDLKLVQEVAWRVALHVDNARLYQRAQEATQQRQDMIAVVSHDLKNPVAAIQMSTRFLRKSLMTNSPTKLSFDLIENIARAADSMRRMIMDLLDTSAMEAGHTSIELQSTTVGKVLEEVVMMFKPIATTKSVELEVRNTHAEHILMCDRDRMIQVFSNLIGNSLKFTPSGGKVSISVNLNERDLVFCVADTGPGIPREQIPQLFKRYSKGHKGLATKGTGLGLYISKGIIEAHKGKIWVESTLGAGTRFYFTVPRHLKKTFYRELEWKKVG